MLPLYHESHFTFRFADDRIIPRFHLEGVGAGRRVDVFRIDPATGEQHDWVDLRNLLRREDRTGGVDVHNGIAWDPQNQRLFVTGKRWPWLFEIRVPAAS